MKIIIDSCLVLIQILTFMYLYSLSPDKCTGYKALYYSTSGKVVEFNTIIFVGSSIDVYYKYNNVELSCRIFGLESANHPKNSYLDIYVDINNTDRCYTCSNISSNLYVNSYVYYQIFCIWLITLTLVYSSIYFFIRSNYYKKLDYEFTTKIYNRIFKIEDKSDLEENLISVKQDVYI